METNQTTVQVVKMDTMVNARYIVRVGRQYLGTKLKMKLRRRGIGGKIKRKPCIICGMKAEAHHPDYSKPLEVVWLCSFHHKEWHRNNTAIAEHLKKEGWVNERKH